MSDKSPSLSLSSAGLSVRGLRNAHAGPFTVDVPRGECLVVAGMSGAGKSVLLRMIADLDPHQGLVALDGVACADMPAHQWRRRVLYLPAEPGWWSDIVLDHVSDDTATRALLDRLGLRESVLRTPVHRLSTGERQRLALVRGLLRGPCVLLLDEPCSALDDATTRKVEALLRDLKAQGLALVLVSHDQAQADRMADRRRYMTSGRFTEDAA